PAATPGTAGEALRLAGAGTGHHRLERAGRDALEERLVPDALARPAPEAAVGRPRRRGRGRKVLPGDPGAQDAGHRLDEPPQGGGGGLPDPGVVTSSAWSGARTASRRRWRGMRGCLGLAAATKCYE